MKQLLYILFIFVLQNFGILFAWIIIASYAKIHIFVIVFLILVVQYVLLRFYFGLNSNERKYNAFIDGVPFKELENESEKIFWTAILTSWLSPTTVWSNNIINKCSLEELMQKSDLEWPTLKLCFDKVKQFFQRKKDLPRNNQGLQESCDLLGSTFKHLFQCGIAKQCQESKANVFFEETLKYKNRSKIIFASGLATNIILTSSFLVILSVLLTTNEMNFRIEENPPITQCLQLLPNMTSGQFKMSAAFLFK